jgi:hypothetical protein
MAGEDVAARRERFASPSAPTRPRQSHRRAPSAPTRDFVFATNDWTARKATLTRLRATQSARGFDESPPLDVGSRFVNGA